MKGKTDMDAGKRNDKSGFYGVIYRLFIGAVFGFANIIPGVSGGTAMVDFGVYERIILIITDFKTRIKTEWRFFLPILIGAGASILAFGMLMKVVLDNHQPLAQMFFIGVIVFSLPMIFKKAVSGERNKKTDGVCAACFALVLLIMLGMAALDGERREAEAAKDVATTSEATVAEATIAEAEAERESGVGEKILTAGVMLVCGAIACATMIIPGISGSLVMVMLGVYDDVIDALSAFDMFVLIPYGIGMLIGVIFCAKLIKYLLYKYSRQTYSAILGFVVGSVFSIFPGWSYALPALAFAVGGLAIAGCEALSKKAGN